MRVVACAGEDEVDWGHVELIAVASEGSASGSTITLVCVRAGQAAE